MCSLVSAYLQTGCSRVWKVALKPISPSLFIWEKKISQLSRLVCPSWAQTLSGRSSSFHSSLPTKHLFMRWKRAKASEDPAWCLQYLFFCSPRLHILPIWIEIPGHCLCPERHTAPSLTGTARYYNTICMLKRWVRLSGCASKCECAGPCVPIDLWRMCHCQGSLSGHCVGVESLLAFNPLLTNLISGGS